MPKILMIAAEFPPCLSAGVHRTYHFAENLLKLGWQPLILSAHPRVYEWLDDKLVVSDQIKKNTRRAFAVDASVNLAVNGKYIRFMEDPDRVASWYYHGWRVGMAMIKEYNPDLIWSSFPVPTAHRIALKLKMKTGKPWVADFRDPLASHVDENKRGSEKAKEIDANTVKHADLVIFATQQIRELYQQEYPHVDAEKFCVIENGFDENVFKNLKRNPKKSENFTLLYSGWLYQDGRDPTPLLHAVSQLRQDEVFATRPLKLLFRGGGDIDIYKEIVRTLQLDEIVEFLPYVSFQQSIQEMQDADALLIIQGRKFNTQIPGKVFEYIGTGNPILGLVGKNSATSVLLDTIPNAHIAEVDNIDEIKTALKKTILDPGAAVADPSQFSRRMRAEAMANELNKLLEAV